MKLTLDRSDLLPEHEDIDCNQVRHEHFKPEVRVAIVAAGGVTFRGLDGISPKSTASLAVNLLQAFEAAYNDAFLVEFFAYAAGVTEAEATRLLVEFRKWREQRQTAVSEEVSA